MQHSHKKFKDETLDFNELDGFSPEAAPSHTLRPPEVQRSPPVSQLPPHLKHRTKEMIRATVFSIFLKTVHKERHCRCPGEVNISHTTGAHGIGLPFSLLLWKSSYGGSSSTEVLLYWGTGRTLGFEEPLRRRF